MDKAVENATFKDNDVFNRKPFGEGVLQLINNETNHNGALTISIDAPWGIGKTTFMKMLQSLIKDKTFGWWTVYYDAWENDMTNDPFTSLLFQICGQCGRQATTEGQKDAIKEYIKKISEAAAGILDMIPDNVYTQVTGKGLTLINSLLKGKEKGTIEDEYVNFEEHKSNLHNNLAAMAKNCNKVIVFVDELDRCKPTFAVHILETIKHYFDIDNVVFIFGIDGIQLRETIKNYYGAGFDSSSYLTRFFEYQLLLPKPSLSQMMKFCYRLAYIHKDTYDYLYQVFDYAKITPREVHSIINGILAVQFQCLDANEEKNINILCPTIVITGLLLSLKCKKMKDYEAVIQGKYKLSEDPDTIEVDMKKLSDVCAAKVAIARNQTIRHLEDPIITSNNINNAIQSMLSGSDETAKIGDELVRLLNLVELPR